MKLKLLGLAIVGSLAVAASSLAGGSPLIAKQLGAGKMARIVIHAKTGKMIFERYTLKPGGSFPWHTHPAPAAAVVTQGTLTVLDPTVHNCAPYKVHKGQAFIEPPHHVHTARNDGKTSVIVYVTYLGVPKGASAVTPTSAPASCSG